jgi:hypothetical protein
MISELQAEVAHILFLFYTSIGIIQRDAPMLGAEEQKIETEASLRLENNTSELIGSMVTTRNRIMAKIGEIERMEECTEAELDRLREESSSLDRELQREIERMDADLPFFKRFLEKRLEAASCDK